MVPEDSEFESHLAFPELIKEYRLAIQETESKTSREFRENREQLIALKMAALEGERAHRNLLNLCVAPFTERFAGNRDLGYEFFRASPLAERGLPNFDFLIARLSPADKPVVLVLGEAKASVGNPAFIVREIVKKKQIAEAETDFLLETYLGQRKSRSVIMEAVVAVDSVDSSNLIAAVIDSGEEIKVWHGPSTGPETLSLATPPRNTPEYHRYMHKDRELNGLLRRLPSLRRVFDIWPQTHPIIQLGGLLACKRQIENTNLVTSELLKAVLDHDMFYLTDKEREELSKDTIQKGMEIGFLESTGIPDEYRIVSQGVRTSILERTLEEKWLKWQLEQDEQREIARRKEAVDERFRQKRQKLKTVEEWGPS